MDLVFFGTGSYAVPSLKHLVKSRHSLLSVITMPDRKKDRKGRLVGSPVKQSMLSLGDKAPRLYETSNVNKPSMLEILKEQSPQLIIVCDFGCFLKEELLSLPDKYCINLHASCLPKWRGASPVNRAILNGDSTTGNSVIKMNSRMDAGPVILSRSTKIEKGEDAVSLRERLSEKGAFLLLEAIELIEKGEEVLEAQDESRATYAPKLQKKEGLIDWSRSSMEVCRQVRGLKPWPGTYTFLKGKRIKILEVSEVSSSGVASPGRVVDPDEFVVACGEGALKIKVLQPAGKKQMDAQSFLKGNSINTKTLLK